jgi:hypothetical protein
MDLKKRILYSHNWNIGFVDQTPAELLRSKSLKPVRWMKHPYRDRWFADPFILKISEDEIVVFVEECQIAAPKGILCELVVDRKTMRLKKRYVLLTAETHLSYPAIFRYGKKVYVYPENGASGQLNIYEYDELNHRLINPVCILKESVADSTILELDGQYYLIATRSDNSQECAFLYISKSLFGPFKILTEEPVQGSREQSRPAGNWIINGTDLFRPAQNCEIRYGNAISMMRVVSLTPFTEHAEFFLAPSSFAYNRGLHTVNFYENVCVIDGYGYLFPLFGKAYELGRTIKHIFMR